MNYGRWEMGVRTTQKGCSALQLGIVSECIDNWLTEDEWMKKGEKEWSEWVQSAEGYGYSANNIYLLYQQKNQGKMGGVRDNVIDIV